MAHLKLLEGRLWRLSGGPLHPRCKPLCARCATRDEEYVVCALLLRHWRYPATRSTTPTLPQRSSSPLVGEANHWMVPASRIFQAITSSHHIGLDGDIARKQFREHPHYQRHGRVLRTL